MIPTLTKTASANMYIKMHTDNLHKYNPGSVFGINTFSITVVQHFMDDKYLLKDILYISLDEAYIKYIDENCETYPSPYENIPVYRLDVLKDRIIYKSLFKHNQDHKEDNKESLTDKIRQYFDKFVEGKCSDEEMNYLDNMMHIDDNLLSDWIVPSQLDLRARAMELIEKSDLGSWLVRRSSVAEQPNVKVRVITIKSNGVVHHYLVCHINGFGYVLTTGSSGDIFPKIGENKPLIMHNVFRSLPSLLTYMRSQGLVLEKIVKS